MQNTPQSQPQEPELAYLMGSTAANGLTFGSEITVPEGYAGLVVWKNQALDAVGSGQCTVDANTFPQLAGKLKLRPGERPNTPVDLTLVLLNVTGAVLSWRARPLLTKDTTRGMTYCDLVGRCAARVVDPARFYTSLKTGMGRALKGQPTAAKSQLANSTLGQQAQYFVSSVIGAAAGNALAQMALPPEQLSSGAERAKQAIGVTAASALAQIGLECTGFEVSNTPQAFRAPCVKCGSPTAPTAYGVYHRTISLLYIRFGARREGNFCVPCATKVWGAYCGVMLVCGWWGIIGLVLTPVYICQNTYYLLKTVFGPKAASGAVGAASVPTGAWPPAPTEWGEELQER